MRARERYRHQKISTLCQPRRDRPVWDLVWVPVSAARHTHRHDGAFGDNHQSRPDPLAVV